MSFSGSLFITSRIDLSNKAKRLQLPRRGLVYTALLVAASIASLPSFIDLAEAEDAPSFTVAKRQEQVEGMSQYHGSGGQGYWTPTYVAVEILSITSKIDSLTIQKITANRGNCGVTPLRPLPATLKFGEVLKARLSCDPLEVVTDTSEGSNTSTWDE